jgi:hypothetical protein
MQKLGLLLVWCALFNIGCSKKTTDRPSEQWLPPADLEVDAFINLLLDGEYHYRALPTFGPEVITKLLTYASDQTAIEQYPSNPISSYRSASVPLGYFVLWTVEHIRLNHPHTNDPAFTYPSQNPVLQRRGDSFDPITDNESLDIIATAYRLWWNESANFEMLRQIDPLMDTDFRWH